MKANAIWTKHYCRPQQDSTVTVTEMMTEITMTLRMGEHQFNVTMDWLEASQLADALHEAAAKAELYAREPGDFI